MARELGALYADPGGRLPAVTPYREYLRWVAAQDAAAGVAAWQAALAGVETGTRLAGLAGGRGARALPAEWWGRVAAATSAGVVAQARAHGWTLNAVVQAAWGVVLARLTGQSDVVFGATVSGRPAEVPGIETMVGLFINTVPVRVRVRPGATVATLVTAVQAAQTALLPYQHVSLAAIQRAVGVGELFDTLVVFENYPTAGGADAGGPAADGGGPRLVPAGGRDATHYPLTVVVSGDGPLRVRLSYRADVFEAGTVAEIGARLERVLGAMATEATQRVSAVEVLSGAERAAVLATGTGATPGVPATTVWGLVAAAAAARPDAVAVEGPTGAQLTYAGLGQAAAQLATVLRGAGAGPEQVVGVALERSVALPVTVLGVLATGAVYLPLDPTYPAERVAWMVADGAPVAVVTTRAGGGGVPAGVRQVALDTAAGRAAVRGARAGRGTPAAAGGAVSLLYTSGSTGRPKGVVTTQTGLVNRLLWMQGTYGLGPADRVLHKTPISFDVAQWELLWPLLAGARLVLLAPGAHREAGAVLTGVAATGVTTLHFVPSMLQAVVDAAGGPVCPSVTRVVCSGEALPAGLAGAAVARRFPRATVHNLYGPTEAAIDVTAWACGAEGAGAPPLGGPMWHTQVYVLDEGLAPVPAGWWGSCISRGRAAGAGVSGQAGLTAERFVADPFGRRGRGCIGRGTGVAWRRTGAASSWGGATSR